ncbi:hypothetical protein LTR84_003200 [Exophiala bonariae]|uniref:Uncharacterized protein n=1 Tax=Exophiala bonariae TaxID=1690606 RepID=A0AAV9N8F5_9EURO|nr:hypothetical protein LTR84_003200 [Exophiala bonariae]
MAQQLDDITDCSTCDSDSDTTMAESPRHSLTKNFGYTQPREANFTIRRRGPLVTNSAPKRPVRRSSRLSPFCTFLTWLVISIIFFFEVPPLVNSILDLFEPALREPSLPPLDPLQVALNLTQAFHPLRQHSMDLGSLSEELAQAQFAMYQAGNELEKGWGQDIWSDHKTRLSDVIDQHLSDHNRLGNLINYRHTDIMLFKLSLDALSNHTSMSLELFTEKVQEVRGLAHAQTQLGPVFGFWIRREADRKIVSYLKWYLKQESEELRELLMQGAKIEEFLHHDENTWTSLTKWRAQNHPHVEPLVFGSGKFQKWWGSKRQIHEMGWREYFAETPYDAIRHEVSRIMELLRKYSVDFEDALAVANASTRSYKAGDVQDSSAAELENLAAALRINRVGHESTALE